METHARIQTQRLGFMYAQEIARSGIGGPVVIGLVGELGAGKTAFFQGFARGLGVRESVRSPTFVLIKTYSLCASKFQVPGSKFQILVHIDCWRLKKPQELLRMGFREIIKNSRAIVLIEWADRVRGMLPRRTLWLKFKHGRKPNERVIGFEIPKP